MSEKRVSAEVDYDDQAGPIIRVRVGDTKVAVYLGDRTGVVTTPDGQHGVEVTGPWHKMPDLLASDEIEQLQKRLSDRDKDWVLAMGEALGTDSGYSVPIVPEPAPFRQLFAALRRSETTNGATPNCKTCRKPIEEYALQCNGCQSIAWTSDL